MDNLAYLPVGSAGPNSDIYIPSEFYKVFILAINGTQYPL